MDTAVQASSSPPATVRDLVIANRILSAHRVVDGFGHISARDPSNPGQFRLSRSKAPGTVNAEDIMLFDLDGAAVDAQGRKVYLERFIHSAIYQARPDVMAVVHSHSPAVIPFGVTKVPLKPVCGVCGFLGITVPVFEIRHGAGQATDLLISTQALGVALTHALGDGPVVLMRGHGSTAVGRSIQQVVYRAIYTEVNARLQADALQLGEVEYLTNDEAAACAATNDAVTDRIWQQWQADAEAIMAQETR